MSLLKRSNITYLAAAMSAAEVVCGMRPVAAGA